MAQQEEGWPLGLQPLNVRVGMIGLVNPPEFSGSLSFNTSLTASPCSSSDLDTQSTGSFFHDKSITLGSLLGVSSIVNELSRRSVRSKTRPETFGIHNTHRPKSWCFSLCPRDHTDAADTHMNHNAASLGHFLAVERRAADEHRRSRSPLIYDGPDEFGLAHSDREPNSLFVDGRIAPPPPQLSPRAGSDDDERRQLDHGNGCGIPVLFPCMC